MSGPSVTSQGEPPTTPTPPTPYQVPPSAGLLVQPRRNHARIVLGIVVGTVLLALVTGLVVIIPLVRQAREQADAALAGLEQFDPPTAPPAGGKATKPPTTAGTDPATPPTDGPPPLAVAVDGRYPLDTYVWFDGDVRVEGTPADGWTAAPEEPARWTKGECGVVQQQGEVITFGSPDGTTTDRDWTVEDIGMNAFFLEDEVYAITPRGDGLELTLPTSDGNALDALGQTYDVTTLDGEAREMVYAARALTWHDLTVQFMLVCPAGTLADPGAAMQQVLDAYEVVLP